eukprot:TRINITY_DN4597_c0_g1_i2.p1 TRINITY_DN4597_c0_g1~~TRINITY_DN4597_c0_g1_i2.p1  ORF type:complete len:295 (+),score=54.11 TRINITY_DN4597_c0_g1_i2:34-885(+)
MAASFPPRVLVTASRGNVGRELVPALQARRVFVVGGVRHVAKDANTYFDFEDLDSVHRCLSTNSIDSVFLIYPESFREAAAQKLHEVLKQEGVTRVIGMAGYIQPLDMLKEAGFTEYSAIAPNWFMQNYNQMYKVCIRDQSCFAEQAASIRTPFIDCRDIADVAVALLTAPSGDFMSSYHGRNFDLTGPDAIDRHDVARVFSSVLGRQVTYKPLEREEYIDFMSRPENGGMGKEEAAAIADVYNSIGEEWTVTKTDNVQKILGRKPRDLADFVHHYADDWKQK